MLLVSSIIIVNSDTAKASTGDILYVGGSGPGNYTKIQDAIDNASDGYTIFVYNGTYQENIVINNSIKLIGEYKNTTIIRGKDPNQNVITVYANHVAIRGFTITGLNNFISNGITLFSNHNVIKDNIILNNSVGISLSLSKYDIIANNTLLNNSFVGISLAAFSSDNTIFFNIIFGKPTYIKNGTLHMLPPNYGIVISKSSNNIIRKNLIFLRNCGILVMKSKRNELSDNILASNLLGIDIGFSKRNKIHNNTLIWNLMGMGFVFFSKINKVTSNRLENYVSDIAIYLGSSFNKFYGNVFKIWSSKSIKSSLLAIDGCHNMWFDRKSRTGNYWSDYNGKDRNGDGRGDKPYIVPGRLILKNRDRYPLMKNPFYTSLNVESLYVQVGKPLMHSQKVENLLDSTQVQHFTVKIIMDAFLVGHSKLSSKNL